MSYLQNPSSPGQREIKGEREVREERGGPSEVVTKAIESREERAFGEPDGVELLAHLSMR